MVFPAPKLFAHAANDKSRQTVNTAVATGKRWCGYHQGQADADKGGFVARNGKRWMCGTCMAQRNISSTL